MEVVAQRLAETERARRLRCDATSVVERLAVRARAAGLAHPVSASLARAARIAHLAGPEDFADRLGVPVQRVLEAESGMVSFGDLPIEFDVVLADLQLDLLALADLERGWRPTGSTRSTGSGW